MKKAAFLLFLSALPLFITAQNCGILEAYDQVFKQNPAARQRVADVIRTADSMGSLSSRPASIPTYTIPVVFHVLHMGGAENISDAQIMDQINIMNIDYTKQNGDTINAVSQFQGLIGNCNAVFSLATRDENGKCTNGITRHYDVNTNWTVDINNYIYTWDRTKYLNIYVVKSLQSGTAAYSFYPGTVPPSVDAIVVRHDYVGSIGTSQPYNSRIITHEAGHWMNLQHPWGGTNQPGVACGDDGVSDTPITKGHTFCDLPNAIDCTPGVTENIQNYMEYAYCQIMFTPGQCTRMHNALNSSVALRTNVWSPANLVATGVVNPLYNCPPVAGFVPSHTLTCVGNTNTFLDESYNTPPTAWRWSSPLASATSGLQNGVLTFTGSGVASVKLKVSNAYGSDSTAQQDVLVLAGPGSGSIGVTQGFETNTLPDDEWLITTPHFGSGFKRTDTAQYNGTWCVWINNFYDNASSAVSLFSPAFNLQFATSSQLSFYYAYSQKSVTDNDQLAVYASSDCGNTWLPVFSQNGGALSTTGIPMNSPFLTPSGNWAPVLVDMLPFCGQPSVYLKFEFTPDTAGAGNNLFIDDINLDATIVMNVGVQGRTLQALKIMPNPFTSEVLITGDKIENISSYSVADLSGRVLIREQKALPFQNAIRVQGLEGLSRGVYLLQVNGASGGRVFKIIRQ